MRDSSDSSDSSDTRTWWRRSSRVAVALYVALLAGGCSVLGPKPEWTSLQTPAAQFLVQENTKHTESWAGRVSWFRPVLEEIVGPMQGLERPIVYLLIAERDEYLEYFPKRESVGVHRSIDGTSIVLVDASQPPDLVVATLMHEYAHYYFDARQGPPVPLWYEEGVAEYAEAVTVDESGVTIGAVSSFGIDLLRESALMPVPLLISTKQSDSRYLDTQEAGNFHLSAWALIHFFRHGVPDGRQLLDRYVEEVAAGAAPRPAMLRVYGKTAVALDKDLREYLDSDHFETDAYPLDRFRVKRPAVWIEALDDESTQDVRSLLDSMKRYYQSNEL